MIPNYVRKSNKLLDRIKADGVDVEGEFIKADVHHDKWCPLYLSGGATCLCNGHVEIEVDGRVYRDE